VGAPLGSLSAQDLIADDATIERGGTHRHDRVRVENGGVIRVRPFDRTNRETTGNIVLIAPEITIDATSRSTRAARATRRRAARTERAGGGGVCIGGASPLQPSIGCS